MRQEDSSSICNDPLSAALLKEIQRAQRGEAIRPDALEGMLSQEEEEGRFRQLLRTKSFWYGVFGTMLLIYFVVLIKFVLDDL